MQNKTLFGKIVLIFSMVYIVGYLAANLFSGYYEINQYFFNPDISREIADTLSLIRMFLDLFSSAVMVLWLVYAIKEKEKKTLPVILTFVYYMANTVLTVLLFYAGDDETRGGFMNFLQYNLTLILSTVSWFVLMLGMSRANKLSFGILQFIAVLIKVSSGLHGLDRIIQGLISGQTGDLVTVSEIIFYSLDLISTFVMGVFVLYILQPELYIKRKAKK